MACYVFGNAITNQTLSEIPMYQDKTITRLDRAREAYKMKNAEGKDSKARNFVEGLYNNWVNFIEKERKDASYNQKRCFLVLIYNATGDTLSYVTNHSFGGIIGRSPYPARIENGQWAGFLHVQDIDSTSGSHGSVVYRGMNNEGIKIDWLVGWKNPWVNGLGYCRVYGEAREKGHYVSNIWSAVDYVMNNHDDIYCYDEPTNGAGSGAVIEVTTGSHGAPVCEAILTLQNVIGANN